MRIRRSTLLWCAAGTATLLLAACGGSKKKLSGGASTAAAPVTTATGGGITGRLQVIGSGPAKTLTVSASPSSPSGISSVAADATNVPVLAVRLATSTGDIDLKGMTFWATGTGDDHADVLSARLGRDTNNNGSLDAGEPVLGTSRVDRDNGSLVFNFWGQRLYSGSGFDLVLEVSLAGTALFGESFAFALTSPQSLASASATTILVTATLSGSAVAGQTFELTLDPPADLTASVAATGGVQHGALLVAGSGEGAVVQPGADLGKDAYLRGEGLYLNDNFGRQGLTVGDRYSGQLGERLFYIETPLPILPAGATPQKAYMALFLAGTRGLNGPSLDVQVFRVVDSGVRTPWTEGHGGLDSTLDGICYDGTIQATNRPDLDHPDASPTIEDEVNVTSGSEGRWVIFDVTAAAQQWYSGAAPNFGLRFRDKDFAVHNDGAISFRSSDYPEAALRPMFLVQY